MMPWNPEGSPLLAILAMSAFVIAAGFSMFGLGGGVLYTPLQVFLGIDFHEAATTSLFLIMVTSLSATLVFHKSDKVDWALAIVLETVTVLGGVSGGIVSGQFSGAALSIGFAALLVIASIFMILEFRTGGLCPPEREGFVYWPRRFAGEEYCVNLLVALPVSFLAGGASGLLGVGGGILKIPLMVLLLGIPMDVAVASSAFMVGVTATGGFLGHVSVGHWDWRTSLVLAVAVFIGAQWGARKSVDADKKKVKKAYGWFLLAIAALMVVKLL